MRLGKKFQHIAEVMDDKSPAENKILMQLLRRHVMETLPELDLQAKCRTHFGSPTSPKSASTSNGHNLSTASDESVTDRSQQQRFGGCKCVDISHFGLRRGSHKAKINWNTVALHQKIIVSTTRQMQSIDHFKNVKYELDVGNKCLHYRHHARNPLNLSIVHKELDPTDILHVLVDGSEPRFLHCKICNKTFGMTNGWKLRMMVQHFLRDSHRRNLQEWTPEPKDIQNKRQLVSTTIPQLFSGAGTPVAKGRIRLLVHLAAHVAVRPTLSFQVAISLLRFTRNLLHPFKKTILEATQKSVQHVNIKQIIDEDILPHCHLLPCVVLGMAEVLTTVKKQQNGLCTVL